MYVCPTSGVPSAGDLPAGVSLSSLEGAGNLDLALKKVSLAVSQLTFDPL